METSNIILIGSPQSGKTTLVKKIIHATEKPLAGFWTEEIREKGHRVGFQLHTVHGKKEVVAHIDFKSEYHVGKYGVDIDRFETTALEALRPENDQQIIVIDEIGKMECFSEKFCHIVQKVLGMPNKVLGTIAQHGSPFMENIKQRPDVQLIPVHVHNRDELVGTICSYLV